MKTLQIKAGRWYAIAGADGSVSYRPKEDGTTARDVAIAIDPVSPPVVTEVIGTGLRLHDDSDGTDGDWSVYDNNARALGAAAFRIRETA